MWRGHAPGKRNGWEAEAATNIRISSARISSPFLWRSNRARPQSARTFVPRSPIAPDVDIIGSHADIPLGGEDIRSDAAPELGVAGGRVGLNECWLAEEPDTRPDVCGISRQVFGPVRPGVPFEPPHGEGRR